MKKSGILLAAVALTAAVNQIQAQSIVATDEMLATGDYTVTGDSIAVDRDSSGSHGLESTAGSHYMRYGGSFTEARSFSTILTDGFLSEHDVMAGEYTASIDIGRSGEDLGRDSFDTFDFRLVTLDGTEIGERIVIEPYLTQPGFGEWTTITVSYFVSAGSPVIGERLTWMADAAFSSSDVGKFGPTDNVQVSYIPEPGTYGLLGGLGALGAVLLVRRRKPSIQ